MFKWVINKYRLIMRHKCSGSTPLWPTIHYHSVFFSHSWNPCKNDLSWQMRIQQVTRVVGNKCPMWQHPSVYWLWYQRWRHLRHRGSYHILRCSLTSGWRYRNGSKALWSPRCRLQCLIKYLHICPNRWPRLILSDCSAALVLI